MKSVFLVVLLVAAATAAVVSNEVPDLVDVPDVVEVIEMADGDEVADGDVNEIPEVIVSDVEELIDVADLTDEAEEPQTAVATRRSLSQGSIAAGERPIYDNTVSANGVPNHFHLRDIRISTNRRVSAVRVTRVGASQNATPSIIGGGVGSSFVTISIRSAVGRGYHYRILVYVR